eukprot:5489625-Amphidinium_carterae.1
MTRRATLSKNSHMKHPPCDALYSSMEGQRTDWGRVRTLDVLVLYHPCQHNSTEPKSGSQKPLKR